MVLRIVNDQICYKLKKIYLYYYIKHLRIGGSIFCHGNFFYTHFIPQLDG
jgi:hypothetical protein